MRNLLKIQPLETITLIGSGNLATALGLSLREAGLVIDQVVARSQAKSMRQAANLAHLVGAAAVTLTRVEIQSKVVWFCVPDGAIKGAAASMADRCDWRGRVALHSSGALSSNELQVLRSQGAAVASAHPLMTFVKGSRPQLEDVAWAVEGDPQAVKVARRVVKNLRGHAFAIRPGDKAAYHAWGMFTSPLITALLSASEKVAKAAGISQGDARKRMLPIVRQTIENYAALGARGGISGPTVRGDAETVRKHLLEFERDAGSKAIYVALMQAALLHLPAKNRQALEKILRNEGPIGK